MIKINELLKEENMKKLIFVVLGIFLFSVPSYAGFLANAPDTVYVTTVRPDRFTILVHMGTCMGTFADSAYIKITNDIGDSLAWWDISWMQEISQWADTTITGLAPGDTHSMYVMVDSAGTRHVSATKSQQTSFVSYIRTAYPNIMDYFNTMWDATSYDGNRYSGITLSHDDSLRLNATAKDSTVIYDTAKYIGMVAKGIQAGDSVNVKFYCMAGDYDQVSGVFAMSRKDSLTITSANTGFGKQWSIPIGCPYYYVRAEGQTGNGKNSRLFLRQQWSRY